MSRVTIATWIYCEPSGEESHYPQVSGNPSSPQFQAVYWKCVATFFASSIRCNPDSPHVLFTTSNVIPRIDGVDLTELFAKWNVKVITVPFTYIPPVGYYGLWRNQFYILDLIKYLAKQNHPESSFVILDSDCIFNKSIGPLEADLLREDLLMYDCELPNDEVANGLDSHDLLLLYDELGLGRTTPPAYFGGEFFAATNTAIQRLAAEIDSLWYECLDRHHNGLKKFNEEAHFLSFLYYKLGYAKPSANGYIGRLWTQRKFRNTKVSDLSLAIWHLPAEKKYGLQRIYKQTVQSKTKFWRVSIGEEYTKFLGAYLGVPRASRLKFLQDTFTAIIVGCSSCQASQIIADGFTNGVYQLRGDKKSLDNGVPNSAVMLSLKTKLKNIGDRFSGKGRVIYVDYPLHDNIGDLLIYQGAELFFQENNLPFWKQYSYHDFPDKVGGIRDEDIFAFHGGGNFGDLFPEHVDLLMKILKKYPNNEMVVLPQTIYFKEKSNEQVICQQLASNKKLHVFPRDKKSYDTLLPYGFYDIEAMPDMAHQIYGEIPLLPAKATNNQLYLVRRDSEMGVFPESVRTAATNPVDWSDCLTPQFKISFGLLIRSVMIFRKLGLPLDVNRPWRSLRKGLVEKGIDLVGPADIIYTNRLHAMLLGLLLGKKVTAFDNTYGKLSSYYETWLKDHPDVEFLYSDKVTTPAGQGS